MTERSAQVPVTDRMLAEMREQPERLTETFAGAIERAPDLERHLHAADSVVLLGRGSSRAACSYGAWALHQLAGKPASVLSPAELAWGSSQRRLDRVLVVVVSQSGASTELVEAARAAVRRGAAVLVVTNTVPSPLTAAGGHPSVLPCQAGLERAIPATKSVTTAMACLLGLALSGDQEGLARAADEVPRLLHDVLVRGQSEGDLSDLRSALFGGEGAGAAVAEEGAIKFREIAQLPVASLELSELLHGSINSARPDAGVVTLALDDLSAALALQVSDAARARGARTIAIGSSAPESADQVIALPSVTPAWGAFLALGALQGLARSTGLALGLDPDRPPGLEKVTIVEGADGS